MRGPAPAPPPTKSATEAVRNTAAHRQSTPTATHHAHRRRRYRDTPVATMNIPPVAVRPEDADSSPRRSADTPARAGKRAKPAVMMAPRERASDGGSASWGAVTTAG